MTTKTKILNFVQKYTMIIALVLVTAFFTWRTNGKLLLPQNLTNIIAQNAYVFVLATGMLLCILTGGNIDLSVGSVVCFVGTIGAVLMIDNLFRDGYKAVFIGTGAEKPRTLGLQGESLGHVLFGLNYLANPKGHKLGDTVAIIGMGNAAMDVARTALRNGSRHVTLYARSKNVTASSSEVSYAELDGAEFVFGMQIEKITDEGPVFRRAIFNENNDIIGYEDEPVQVQADSTIISISQMPRRKLARTTDGLEMTERGLLAVDENYMTTRPGVFGAGDVVTGAKTVVHAVDGAKKAAEAMIRYMENN